LLVEESLFHLGLCPVLNQGGALAEISALIKDLACWRALSI